MNEATRIQREIALHEAISSDYRERYGYPFSSFYNHYWNDRIIGIIPYHDSLRVLDLGCGTGFLLSDILTLFPNAYGLDLSQDMLLVAKEKKSINYRLVAGDGTRLPFLNGSFDVVMCRGSLHHLPSLNSALREIYRVLAAGGYLVFSEPSNGSLIVRLARRIMYRLSDKFDEEDEGYRMETFADVISSNGFHIKSMQYLGMLGYIFAGFPDRLGLLKHIPGNRTLVQFFIAFDEIIERAKLLHGQCFQILGCAQKQGDMVKIE